MLDTLAIVILSLSDEGGEQRNAQESPYRDEILNYWPS